jgi:anti-anti-sigma factor
MNATLIEPNETLVVQPGEMTELVRGDEQSLIRRVAPMLREKNIALDLHQIDRIDAAGVAALISLYSTARNSGHKFSVCNVSERVAEILELVGLAPIFLSHNAVYGSQCEPCYGRSAA